MRCYLVNGGGIDQLTMAERSASTIAHDDDVLVDVKACSINYRDLMVAKGQYQSKGVTLPPFVAFCRIPETCWQSRHYVVASLIQLVSNQSEESAH